MVQSASFWLGSVYGEIAKLDVGAKMDDQHSSDMKLSDKMDYRWGWVTRWTTR